MKKEKLEQLVEKQRLEIADLKKQLEIHKPRTLGFLITGVQFVSIVVDSEIGTQEINGYIIGANVKPGPVELVIKIEATVSGDPTKLPIQEKISQMLFEKLENVQLEFESDYERERRQS